MPTWASSADVNARVAYGTISASSNPNSTQVDGFLDEAEAQVRQILQNHGISTDLGAGTDERFVAQARTIDYALAYVLLAWGVQRPELLDEARAARDRFESYLEELRNRPTSHGAELTADGDVPQPRTRVVFTDADGATPAQRIQMDGVYD